MELVKLIVGERPAYLNYTMAVMFDMAEKYGDINSALEIMSQDTPAALDAVRWFAVRMSKAGRLHMKDSGEDVAEITDEHITSDMRPIDFMALKEKVVRAINLGYSREVPSPKEDEIDLVLAELEKKTNAPA